MLPRLLLLLSFATILLAKPYFPKHPLPVSSITPLQLPGLLSSPAFKFILYSDNLSRDLATLQQPPSQPHVLFRSMDCLTYQQHCEDTIKDFPLPFIAIYDETDMIEAIELSMFHAQYQRIETMLASEQLQLKHHPAPETDSTAAQQRAVENGEESDEAEKKEVVSAHLTTDSAFLNAAEEASLMKLAIWLILCVVSLKVFGKPPKKEESSMTRTINLSIKKKNEPSRVQLLNQTPQLYA